VLRLSPKLQLEDGFAPTGWARDNAADADLGSMAPVLLPNGMIFAAGKTGQGYLLQASALGGVGGQVQVQSVCNAAFGGAATLGSTVFVPCDDGIRQVQVGSGASFTVGWHAPGNVTSSPVVGGHTVYSLDPAGTLYALDAESGTVRTKLSIERVSRFTSPTLSGSNIFVGTMSGVVAITVS
jgi:outer membrane protein assembly factor BamB